MSQPETHTFRGVLDATPRALPAQPGPQWLRPACRQVNDLLVRGLDGAGLRTRATKVLHTLLDGLGLPDLERLALHPAATPFVPLLDALARDLGVPPSDPRLQACGDATLLSYLHVRVQDDVVDEPGRWDMSYTFVADTFAAASVDAFVRATAGPSCAAFFAFRARALQRFFAVAVAELDARKDGAALDEQRLAEKFLPLAVCLGALAFAVGRDALAGVLTEVVLGLGQALQRANDLLNATEDWAACRRTPALNALKREVPLEPGCSVRLELLQSDALADEVARAVQALREAEQLARDAGLPALAGLIASRQAFVRSVPKRLLRLELGGGIT